MDGSTPSPMPQQYYIPFPGYFNTPPMFFGPPFSYADYNPGWYYPPPASSASSSKSGINRASILTPAIVASVALLGSAILLVSYYKIFAKYCTAWQQLLGLSSRNNNDGGSRFRSEQQHLEQQGGWFLAMNSGLDESIVRRIPIYVYRSGDGIASSQECVVCLGEFEEEDELRILPKCSHAFHVGCIDVWLQSHSNCPLCRAPVVSSSQPPVIQSIENRAIDEHEQQGQQHEHIIALQIEDDEAGRNSNPDPCNVEDETRALQRSSSMRVDDHRRKSWRWRMVPLRRSNSTGSHHLVSYQDLVLAAYNQTLASPALILAPHNSAELDKQGDGGEDDGYVVLDIEIASSSSSSQREAIDSGGSSRSPSRLSARRSLFKASSLRRSISSGSRVFSFRRFARSRSVA